MIPLVLPPGVVPLTQMALTAQPMLRLAGARLLLSGLVLAVPGAHAATAVRSGWMIPAVPAQGTIPTARLPPLLAQAATPPAPTGLTTAEGNASVTLSWTSGGNGGSTITQWQYARRQGNNDFGAWKTICVTSSDSTCPARTSYTVFSLTNNTSYTFKVRAVNSVGNGTASAVSQAATPSLFCGRTPKVRDAIVAKVPGKSTCGAITDADLSAITSLWVTHQSSLTTLQSGDFDGLTSLRLLELNDNSLSSLPAGLFDDLSRLRDLDLGDNNLGSLPAGLLDELSRLEDLDLSSNSLSGLPSGFFDELDSLVYMNLSGNSLSSLPVDLFDELGDLEDLDLSNNSFSSIPAGLFDELDNVDALHLDGNRLSSLPTGLFDEMTSLGNLYLKHNQLSSLPADIFDELTGVAYLDLDHNHLSSLPAGLFDEMTSLWHLQLNANRLTSLPAGLFDALTGLVRLDLDSNRLASLPVGVFDRLTGLSYLDLRDNNLTSLKAGVFNQLHGLWHLYLGGNNLGCLPYIPNRTDSYFIFDVNEALAACDAVLTITINASASTVAVDEGRTTTYAVVLEAYPTGDVTVVPSSGSTATATVSGTLTFTQGNWNTAQSVTVTGVTAGSTTVAHQVSGGGYGGVTAEDVPVTVTTLSIPTIAQGAGGNSWPAAFAVVTPGGQSPPAPSNLVVEATVTADGTTASLSWDPYSTSPDDCFNVQYRDNAESNISWRQARPNCSKGTSYTVTGLDRGTSYAFRLQWVNEADRRITSAWSAVVTVAVPGEQDNRLPTFDQAAADQTATEGLAFTYTLPEATDPEGAPLTYSAVVLGADDRRTPLPRWLAFDRFNRQLSGTPQQDDAPAAFTIEVRAAEQAPGNVTLSASTTFRLTVEEPLTSAQIAQVARQWLARFGRTVSSQVVAAVGDRLAVDVADDSIVLNGQPLALHSSPGTTPHRNGNAAGTGEAVAGQHLAPPPTIREWLTSSSFHLSRQRGEAKAPGGSLAAGHGWTVWGETAFTNFDGADADLSLDGEVLTGIAAVDWQREQWLLGLGLSWSQGDGRFTAPATVNGQGVDGTVRSSLTAIHPYARYRPRPGVEFRGVAGYGSGSMTLNPADTYSASKDPANPAIWLTMLGIGGRSTMLSAAASGGPVLDVVADALFTRTGAADAASLREAVSASTTRLRLGLEGVRSLSVAEGAALTPTLTAALRYDAGDAETGLGLELGTGLTYAHPRSGLALSAGVRGLLSDQEGEGGAVFREWGGSASLHYHSGGDGPGFTVTLSPAWGMAESGIDRLWSDHGQPLAPQAQSSAVASSGAARLNGEIGYGLAAFADTVVITPFGGLTLAQGTRDWQLGSRLDFNAPWALTLTVERQGGTSQAADHGIRLNLMGTW